MSQELTSFDDAHGVNSYTPTPDTKNDAPNVLSLLAREAVRELASEGVSQLDSETVRGNQLIEQWHHVIIHAPLDLKDVTDDELIIFRIETATFKLACAVRHFAAAEADGHDLDPNRPAREPFDAWHYFYQRVLDYAYHRQPKPDEPLIDELGIFGSYAEAWKRRAQDRGFDYIGVQLDAKVAEDSHITARYAKSPRAQRLVKHLRQLQRTIGAGVPMYFSQRQAAHVMGCYCTTGKNKGKLDHKAGGRALAAFVADGILTQTRPGVPRNPEDKQDEHKDEAARAAEWVYIASDLMPENNTEGDAA